jgi:quercetin dioxygenase-like cupin family protein
MTNTGMAEFEARVGAEGYKVVPRELGPNQGLGDHTHDFDAWGLVTSGEFHITIDGKTTVYGTGDEFKLPAGCLHSEKSGPAGVTFLAGRRQNP